MFTEVAEVTELVVAPVTITPTKPLTPTHVKGLLWTDLLVKASSRLTGVQLVWNNRMATVTTQSTAFWRYLDLTEPDTDWSAESEAGIGARYLRFHAEHRAADPRALAAYLARADQDGWIHPSGLRMLELWRAELDLLGVGDLGLGVDRPLATTAQAMTRALADRGMLIDHRRFGGPVYLDGPRWGMPLRQLVSSAGHANYLLPILRELVPMIREGRRFLLVHDEELTSDYLLLDRVLTEFGAAVTRVGLSRVPVNGTVRSSRYGGWSGVTLSELSATPGTTDHAAYRLGMRLYFAGALHRRSGQPFRMQLLRRCVGRAARMLDESRVDADWGDPDKGDPGGRHLTAALARLRTRQGYVDPYRLTAAMQGKRAALSAAALRTIYT
ncbi:hypothetical protein [Streptomyces sp. SID9727]|uniref:hypothetical protein n=1 Tax=Streptomyces sp. SID9727 TaxID=2706114 RepID=UPI0013CDC2BB|nr:hypothetical protein [Streptomyces sp. SID9727]NEC66306.1 hypothetical protein [Streptomyces sp. SID9727]